MLTKYTLIKFLLAVPIALFLSACGGDDDNDSPAVVNTVVDVAVANGNFTTLVAALEATGLDAVLDDEDGSFTVFAPTDAAFALLGEETINNLLSDTETLSDILLYHVISGQEVGSSAAIAAAGTTVEMANGDSVGLSLNGSNLLINLSTVTQVNIAADNGVIHVIDAVLMPPTEMGTPTNNIAEIVIADENFETLLAALQAASLDTVLADEDSTFTVFAPTDDAFAQIPEATLNALIADTDTLSDILLQHVVAGAAVNSVTAFTLNGTEVETASGAMIDVAIVDGVLQVGGASVVTYDIYANNGIIHVIDTVIVGDVTLTSM